MASSSLINRKYDVFLSFRGEDIRYGFASHLYEALYWKKINSFRDDEILREDKVSSFLLKAIEQSTISIVIFSKNYAFSLWCLDELVSILECNRKYGQIVIPVFYHVDPSDVRNQMGSFEIAFAKHEKRFKERVRIWRSALRDAASIYGLLIGNSGNEAEGITLIVEEVLKRLNFMSSSEIKDLMASAPPAAAFYPSSKSIAPKVNKYDVYLSFRGEDTRFGFASHLYAALCQKKINTFIEDELLRGDEISRSLLKAIEESTISIVILSKNYASSRWCLDELVNILECREKYGQIVIPVFYHVHPSDLRKQRGSFEIAFAKHEEHFKERVLIWRSALRDTAFLYGLLIGNTGSQVEGIKLIVESVIKILNHMCPSEIKDLMASAPPAAASYPSSKSIAPKVNKYDVYLSFRGEDTRLGFASHLYTALCRKRINTFIEDKLLRGDEVSPSLMKAIEESTISIVIFSKNYALSPWCLDELVNILECRNKYGRSVIPVFYHVDPPNVRKQMGSFKIAFAKHEKLFKERVQIWRSALRHAASLSGFVMDNGRYEAEEIKLIVESVVKILNPMSPRVIIDLMASAPPAAAASYPSKSIAPEVKKYDVYLSFRGEDTRNNFTSHLNAALCQKKIEAFVDSPLIQGDELSSSPLKEIEQSKISVIIFSKGYASSQWCLEELLEILKCKEMYGQVVMPVFYHVQPSDVRDQTGTFGDAFAELNERLKEGFKKEHKWRSALREAASLSNWYIGDTGCESDFVKEIVEFILKKLNYMYPSDYKDLVGDYKDLVKIQSSIDKIESSLQIGPKGVRIVGLWGIGGVGKTTIAKVIFDKVRSQFENSYFALNVREESESPNGLTPLRQELLHEIFKDQHSKRGYTFIHQRLTLKKVLIVFDDVTSFEQIEFLIGDLLDLGLGSRIIITTRDEQLLTQDLIDSKYEVKPLSHREALQLFTWYAFHQSCPTLGYDDLSNIVVKYAKGIPLALKVLGSFLRGKRKRVWLSAIDTLERTGKGIKEVLKVSYYGLDNDEKNIFLDIACFLRWENRDFVINFLDASGFFVEIGISVLIDKCLITISENKICMHNLLREMGWEIVRHESDKNIGEQSRLWHHVDIAHVLRKNEGTRAIEGLCLDMSKIRVISLNSHAFARMHNLRFLKLYNSHYEEDNINKVLVSQLLETFLTKLRYLYWHGCPLKSLQSNFHLGKLFALDLSHSKVEKLWTDVQHFYNLKHINLSHSKHLLEIPDLSLATNMESLILEGCTNLVEISSSIEHLNKLVILNLRHCGSLKNLPSNICKLKSLEHLDLSGCLELNRLPDDLGNLEALKVLEAEMLAISEVPSSLLYLHRLIRLNLIDCCITELPNNLDQLSSLESLLLSGNNFESIPASIIDLPKLTCLELGYCEMLQSLPELPCSLESIDAQGCTSLKSSCLLSILSAFHQRLLRVDFSNCFKLDQDAIKNVVKDALQKISCMTKEFYPRPSACICFPGSEIPEWFNFQNLGSSITLLLPPGWFNPKFVSFALCAVVEFRNYQDKGQGLVVCCDCMLRSKKGVLALYHGTLRGWHYDIGSHYVDSDHIFLGYDFDIFSNDSGNRKSSYNNEVCIKFYIEDLNTKRLDCCKVSKCGVYLLYRQETMNPAKVSVEEEQANENPDDEEEEYLSPMRIQMMRRKSNYLPRG